MAPATSGSVHGDCESSTTWTATTGDHPALGRCLIRQPHPLRRADRRPRAFVWSSGQDKAPRAAPRSERRFLLHRQPRQPIYGLGIDANHHLFVSGWQTSKLHRIDVLTDTVEWTLPAAYESRGVAVTADGDVWTANSSPGTVSRFSNNGLLKATIPVGAAPTGVAIDAADKVWVVHNSDDTIRRIDPATNSVDLVKNLPGTRHYGYSDMTGIVSRNATTSFGYWSVVHDSRIDQTGWTDGRLERQRRPPDTSLTVMVRSSGDGSLWSPWETAENGEPAHHHPARPLPRNPGRNARPDRWRIRPCSKTSRSPPPPPATPTSSPANLHHRRSAGRTRDDLRGHRHQRRRQLGLRTWSSPTPCHPTSKCSRSTPRRCQLAVAPAC